jgi:hypothetical protein
VHSGDAGAIAAGLASAGERESTAPASAVKAGKSRSDDGGGAVDVLADTFLSGFGLVSIFKGLLGGGNERETVTLNKYMAPSRLLASAGFDSEMRELTTVDYDAQGQVRSVRPTNVTVNVQAMDSKSFVDHRDDIARAVREALLHSHSLADVIGDI